MWICVSALKMIYHSLFHSVMAYGIMFLRNSPHSPVISKMWKRVIRILMGSGFRESCRGLFKEIKILTRHSIFSLCYCLLFLTGVTLPQIVFIVTLTPDKRMTCICLTYPWLYIWREFFTLVFKFLMPFPWQLRAFLAIPKCLKFL